VERAAWLSTTDAHDLQSRLEFLPADETVMQRPRPPMMPNLRAVVIRLRCHGVHCAKAGIKTASTCRSRFRVVHLVRASEVGPDRSRDARIPVASRSWKATGTWLAVDGAPPSFGEDVRWP
jgi:hypothetical protein